MDTTQTHYAVLGVERDASRADIRRAYLALARTAHPDKNDAVSATRDFQRISDAYEVLSDPARREAYDQELEQAEHERRRQAERERQHKAERERRGVHREAGRSAERQHREQAEWDPLRAFDELFEAFESLGHAQRCRHPSCPFCQSMFDAGPSPPPRHRADEPLESPYAGRGSRPPREDELESLFAQFHFSPFEPFSIFMVLQDDLAAFEDVARHQRAQRGAQSAGHGPQPRGRSPRDAFAWLRSRFSSMRMPSAMPSPGTARRAHGSSHAQHPSHSRTPPNVHNPEPSRMPGPIPGGWGPSPAPPPGQSPMPDPRMPRQQAPPRPMPSPAPMPASNASPRSPPPRGVPLRAPSFLPTPEQEMAAMLQYLVSTSEVPFQRRTPPFKAHRMATPSFSAMPMPMPASFPLPFPLPFSVPNGRYRDLPPVYTEFFR